MLGAIGIVLGFVFAQGVGFSLFDPGDITAGSSLATSAVWGIAGIQLTGIAFIAILALFGVTSAERLGLRRDRQPASSGNSTRSNSTRRNSTCRGLRLLAPGGLVVIAPTLLIAALGTGDPVVAPGFTASRLAAFLVLAVLIAVNEELWFRGLMVDHLERAGLPALTIAASAILFGLPHVADTSASWLNAAGVTLAVAIPFTIVRMHVRSLWPLVAWHALIDAWAFVHTASVVPEGTPTAAEALVAIALPSAIAAGYVAWHVRQSPRRRRATAPRR